MALVIWEFILLINIILRIEFCPAVSDSLKKTNIFTMLFIERSYEFSDNRNCFKAWVLKPDSWHNGILTALSSLCETRISTYSQI